MELTTVADIRRAADHLAGVAVRTPLVRTATASGLWLKPENLQPMGAFKIRGAMHAVAEPAASRSARPVCSPTRPAITARRWPWPRGTSGSAAWW